MHVAISANNTELPQTADEISLKSCRRPQVCIAPPDEGQRLVNVYPFKFLLKNTEAMFFACLPYGLQVHGSNLYHLPYDSIFYTEVFNQQEKNSRTLSLTYSDINAIPSH